MTNPALMRTILAILSPFVGFSVLGCDSQLTGPTSASETPQPPKPAPTVELVTPDTGSTSGDTWLKVTGTGFIAPALVTIGGIIVEGRFDHSDPPGTVLYANTPAHLEGAVDVVVTNPDRQTGTLAGGFTYASPDSFDFNGSWWGWGRNGQDIPILFTIENNRLTRVACDSATLEVRPPVPVSNGEFAVEEQEDVIVAGKIVAAGAAIGTINLWPCTRTDWSARRQ